MGMKEYHKHSQANVTLALHHQQGLVLVLVWLGAGQLA